MGLVLIDAAHEHQPERLLAALSVETPDELTAVAEYGRALCVHWADPMANAEGIDNLANSALMRDCGPLDDLPLVVVSRGRAQAPAGLPPDLVVRREQAWRHMQGDLAALSSRSTHLIAEHSGHLMNEDQPETVVEGIRHALALLQEHDDHADDAAHDDLVPGDGTP